MRVQLLGRYGRGSSTFEILLAFAVITLALTAVVTLVFSNQYLAQDIEATSVALSRAQATLEDARALARFDFNTLNATSGLSVLQQDDYTKQATALVSWESAGRHLNVTLSTLITNGEGSEAGEACSSVLVGDWSHAQLTAPTPVGTPASNHVSAVLAFDQRLVVAANSTHLHDDDVYLYDAAGSALVYKGGLDANAAAAGINDLALSSTTAGLFVYAASDKSAEVEVLDVSHAAPALLLSYKLPTSTTPFITGGHVNALAYHEGHLYVGLSKTNTGPEFVVLDVGAGGPPASPVSPVYAGGYPIGAGVSDIVLKRGVAYVSTADNARELLTFDVSNPHAPTLLGSYHPPGSTAFGSAQTLAVVGSTLYLGRSYDNPGPEWYALGVLHPAAPSFISSLNIATTTSPQSVNGVLVRDTLAYIVARDSVQLWSVATSSAPSLIKNLSLSALGVGGTAMACQGNAVYIGGYRTSDNKGVLYTLSP